MSRTDREGLAAKQRRRREEQEIVKSSGPPPASPVPGRLPQDVTPKATAPANATTSSIRDDAALYRMMGDKLNEAKAKGNLPAEQVNRFLAERKAIWDRLGQSGNRDVLRNFVTTDRQRVDIPPTVHANLNDVAARQAEFAQMSPEQARAAMAERGIKDVNTTPGKPVQRQMFDAAYEALQNPGQTISEGLYYIGKGFGDQARGVQHNQNVGPVRRAAGRVVGTIGDGIAATFEPDIGPVSRGLQGGSQMLTNFADEKPLMEGVDPNVAAFANEYGEKRNAIAGNAPAAGTTPAADDGLSEVKVGAKYKDIIGDTGIARTGGAGTADNPYTFSQYGGQNAPGRAGGDTTVVPPLSYGPVSESAKASMDILRRGGSQRFGPRDTNLGRAMTGQALSPRFGGGAGSGSASLQTGMSHMDKVRARNANRSARHDQMSQDMRMRRGLRNMGGGLKMRAQELMQKESDDRRRNAIQSERNQIALRGQNLDTQLGYDQLGSLDRYRQDSLDLEAAKMLASEGGEVTKAQIKQVDEMLTNAASIVDKEGNRITDPGLYNRVASLMGIGNLYALPPNEVSALLPRVQAMAQIAHNYEALTDTAFTDSSLLQGSSWGDIDWSDVGQGTIGITDKLAEVFDFLPWSNNVQFVDLPNVGKTRLDLLTRGVPESAGEKESRRPLDYYRR